MQRIEFITNMTTAIKAEILFENKCESQLFELVFFTENIRAKGLVRVFGLGVLWRSGRDCYIPVAVRWLIHNTD